MSIIFILKIKYINNVFKVIFKDCMKTTFESARIEKELISDNLYVAGMIYICIIQFSFCVYKCVIPCYRVITFVFQTSS